ADGAKPSNTIARVPSFARYTALATTVFLAGGIDCDGNDGIDKLGNCSIPLEPTFQLLGNAHWRLSAPADERAANHALGIQHDELGRSVCRIGQPHAVPGKNRISQPQVGTLLENVVRLAGHGESEHGGLG